MPFIGERGTQASTLRNCLEVWTQAALGCMRSDLGRRARQGGGRRCERGHAPRGLRGSLDEARLGARAQLMPAPGTCVGPLGRP
jgi:hypothetical protein